jgi:hypothetical protein
MQHRRERFNLFDARSKVEDHEQQQKQKNGDEA